LVAGLLIAGAIWIIDLHSKGATVAAAFRGEVEDAIGLLEAVAFIGALVGTGVGLVYGLSGLGAYGTNDRD
jgi:hypothetical protein